MGNLFALDVSFLENDIEIPIEGTEIEKAVHILSKSMKTIALTGSGISADSGIPTFRHEDGIWKKYNMKEFGTLQMFCSQPEKIWQLTQEFNNFDVSPNLAHYALKEMEKLAKLKCIFTQNIDSLHHKAGSTDVIEFHGNGREAKCMKCDKVFPIPNLIRSQEVPPKCITCKEALKPNFTLFGEKISPSAFKRLEEEVVDCDVLLVIGSSMEVSPAREIPALAKSFGSKIIEINITPTCITEGITDLFLQGNSSQICSEIVEQLKHFHKSRQ